MEERSDGRPNLRPAAVDAWKKPCAAGAVFAVSAVMLLWGAFRPFRPPPEEPESVKELLDESAELIRFSEEYRRLSRERSRITDAIDERIEALEARRAASPDRAALDDELKRLRQESLDELLTTSRLLDEKSAEREAKNRRGDTKRRREQVGRAAYAWQRGRSRLLAMAAAACALSGWLFFQAIVLRRRPADAWAAAGGRLEAATDHHPAADAGDPQWNQKLMFYPVQVAVCIGAILFGLLGSAPQAGAKDEREGLVVVGLLGLAFSTIWLFFGSIDWSEWNAIKGVMTGRRPAGKKDESRSDDR